MYKFLIAVKSGTISGLLTAYNFVAAALQNPNVVINVVFFYQDGANILLNTEISKQWENLLLENNLSANICTAAYKKRGLMLKSPFKATSLIKFIADCDLADRIIQF